MKNAQFHVKITRLTIRLGFSKGIHAVNSAGHNMAIDCYNSTINCGGVIAILARTAHKR